MLYIGQNYLTAKTQKVVLSSPKLKGDFHRRVDKGWSESQKAVLLCYMVIRGLLTEFVDIIGTIDRNQTDKNKHRMRTKCTLEHK